MFDHVSKLFDRLVETENGCRVFTGALDTSRYGIVWYKGANRGAHIVSYEYHNGPIPKGMCVLHTCDNPPCCEPTHLFLGTKRDNAADMFAKGRAYIRRGSEVNTSKLCKDEVIEIYQLLESGNTHRRIAELFNLNKASITAIASGRNWKHVYSEYYVEKA